MPLINNDQLDEPLGGKKGNLTRIIIIILNPHSNLNTGITVWSMQASKKKIPKQYPNIKTRSHFTQAKAK